MQIIFATHNRGKLHEMRKILSGFDVLSAEEAGVSEGVVEDGETFRENALKKAHFVAKRTGEWTIADDSGLCVEVLHGAPGVHSARWAPRNKLVEMTLTKMKDVPVGKRSAYFESVAALVAPDGREWTFSGRVKGQLAVKPCGQALPNLPYDVIFIPEGHKQTFAEMAGEKKNTISHRGRSFAKLKKFILSLNN